MYHRATIEQFIKGRAIGPEQKEAIAARLDEVCEEGIFSGGRLDEVLGDLELIAAFHQAWETDGSLRVAGF